MSDTSQHGSQPGTDDPKTPGGTKRSAYTYKMYVNSGGIYVGCKIVKSKAASGDNVGLSKVKDGDHGSVSWVDPSTIFDYDEDVIGTKPPKRGRTDGRISIFFSVRALFILLATYNTMASIDNMNKAEQLTRLGFNLCTAAAPEIVTMMTPFFPLFVVRNKNNKTERDATLTSDEFTAFRKELYTDGTLEDLLRSHGETVPTSRQSGQQHQLQ